MVLESKNRVGDCAKDAAKELARLTGRSKEEFEASNYEIPDFKNQELVVKEETED